MEMNGQNQQPFTIPISAISGTTVPVMLTQSPAATTSTPGKKPILTTYRLITTDGGTINRLVRYPSPVVPIRSKAGVQYVQRSPAASGQMIAQQGQPRFVIKKQSPVAAPMKNAGNQLRLMNSNGSPVTQMQQQQFAQQQILFNNTMQQQQHLVFNQQGMSAPSASRLVFGGGQKQQQMIQISQQPPDRGVGHPPGRARKKSDQPRPGSAKKSPASGTPPQPSNVGKKSILMRLRCRTRPLPLHSTYYDSDTNEVLEKDADVIFMCGDGGRVRGHKVILASQSRFFTDAFQDQPIGEITMVSIPDITSDIMKLIIFLAYKRSVVVNSDQIEKMKDYFDMFGVDFENLSAEPPEEEGPLDVNPGAVFENIQSTSVNAGGNINNNNTNFQQGGRRKMMPSFTSEQLESLQHMNKKVPVPSQAFVDRINRNRAMGGKDMDGSDHDESFTILGYTNESELERRKAKLAPRIETERMDAIDAELTNLPELDENAMKLWVNSVGKDDPDAQRSTNERAKRCKFCSATFFTEAAWKWHEDRHFNHGIYKCTICDTLKNTVRAIWLHEQGAHKYVALPLEDVEESQIVFKSAGSPQKTNYKSMDNKFRQLKQLDAARKSRLEATAAARADWNQNNAVESSIPTKTYRASPQQVCKIRQPEDDEAEVKRIKQLHWMFVCARCDNLSDNSEKAQLHYDKCYPDGGVQFESTVAKYRQGFYGRSRCPLGTCIRRYVTNGGWAIHVGHSHDVDYRKLFSHTGPVEDKIKCETCSRKFAIPEEFHCHLYDGKQCNQSPINEEAMTLLSPTKNSSSAAAETVPAPGSSGSNNSRKKMPTTAIPETDKKEEKQQPIAVKSKPAPIPPSSPVQPPRSARLAKRASALLMQKVLHDQGEDDEEGYDEGYSKKSSPLRKRAKIAKKRRTLSPSSSISSSSATAAVVAVQQPQSDDYPPIECPICGTEIVDFSQHFSTDHKDMKVSVDRLSADLLKCRQCSMTFGIDDIFGHPGVCGKNKQVEGTNDDDARSDVSSNLSLSQNSTINPPFESLSGSSPTKREKKKMPEMPLVIPPELGTSPIDEMEYSLEELMVKEIVLSTLKCPVCFAESNRMGIITHCLKQHGIHRCSICFNTYSNKKDYESHMKACHCGPPAFRPKCPLCNKVFINVGQCVGHMHLMHWPEYFKKTKSKSPHGRVSNVESSNQAVADEQEDKSENTKEPGKDSKEMETEEEKVVEEEETQPDVEVENTANEVADDKNDNENDVSKMEEENDKNDDKE